MAWLIAVLALASGCTSDPQQQIPSPRDAGDVADAADAGDAGDVVELPPPVQLQMTKRPPPDIDCGPGCRVFLGPTQHSGWIPFAYSADYIADTTAKELMVRRVGDKDVSVINQTCSFPHFEGNSLACTFAKDFPLLEMAVVDLKTWQAQTYFRIENGAEDRANGNVLTDRYLYWTHMGWTTRADRKTGAIKDFAGSLLCDWGCFSGGSIYCNLGKAYRLDPETLEGVAISPSTAAQISGACTADRKRFVWVDFRDPPGPGSHSAGPRVGGEVYTYEFATGETKRLTFDSPDAPVTKDYAAIGDDVAVWIEACATCPKSFPNESAWIATPKAFVRLDLATKKRCRYEMERTGAFLHVYGRHLYTYWNDATTGLYVIDIDMDDPAVPWVCE
jgi:hypothetical protein